MKLIILGDGGHSKVIQDMIHLKTEYKIIAILDDKYHYPVNKNSCMYGPLVFLNKIIAPNTKVVIAIGDNAARQRLTARLSLQSNQYATIIHPSAIISPSVIIGHGTVVMPGTCMNAGAIIGDHCIINTGAIVEHDSIISDFTHISPNATLAGNVSIGKGAHIGSSATIIPGMEVGSWSIVGAGSTVIEQIPSFCTAVGSPTRIVNRLGKEIREIRL